jgi:hypothetical protein
MIERSIQFIDRMWTEGIANVWSIECDAHTSNITGAVVGDVGEVKPEDNVPLGGIENF